MLRRLKGAYSGRLAFDPETGFHTDPAGNKVVTFDGGKTWRYAQKDDKSHLERYHRRHVVVDATANAPEAERELHHYAVQPSDDHYMGVEFHTDQDAPTKTSHTEAWA